MLDILVPTVVLTLIVLALVLLVLVSRRLIGASGTVTIRVGDGQAIACEAGRRLLWVLAEAGIHLPGACGGKGACGQCRVRIHEGRPPLSQMGAEHINPRDADAGDRLACMVRTWQDMHVEIDPVQLGRQQWTCEVVSSRSISLYLKELVLRLPGDERLVFRAGDYVQVTVPPYHLDFGEFRIDPPFDMQWRRLGLSSLVSETRDQTVRAYSLANPPRDDREVRLVVRIATPPLAAPPGTPPGRCSSYLFGLKPGDTLLVSGPFGTFHATDSNCEMVLIAGGAGIAPMRSIILDQLDRPTGRRMSLWFGARNPDDLCYHDEFRALAERHAHFDFHPVVSEPRADDDWTQATGFVHQVVYERFLKDHPEPAGPEYYLCGPPVMATAVIGMLEGLGVPPERILMDDFE